MLETACKCLSFKILLIFAVALLPGCTNEQDKPDPGPALPDLPTPDNAWQVKLGNTECQPSAIKLDYIATNDLIVALYSSKQDAGKVYLVQPQKGLLDSFLLNSEHDLLTTQIAVWDQQVCIASDRSITLLNSTITGWGDHKELNVPEKYKLVELNSEGVTIMASGESDHKIYLFAPRGEKLYWEEFTTNADVNSVKRNSQGRWTIGSYHDLLIVEGDTLFPKPREKQMAYLAFAGNYQGNDWGRQIGGTVPGKPRDWQASIPLDLQTDPAGYGWVLWQGDLANRTVNASVLGVNFYDPSGILLKNLVFQAPGRAWIERSLQLMKNSQLCIHSTYRTEDIAAQNQSQEMNAEQEWFPVQSVLIFDRQGNVILDRSLVLKKGQEVKKAIVSNGKLLLTGIFTPENNQNDPGSDCSLFHDIYSLN